MWFWSRKASYASLAERGGYGPSPMDGIQALSKKTNSAVHGGSKVRGEGGGGAKGAPAPSPPPPIYVISIYIYIYVFPHKAWVFSNRPLDIF